MPATTDSPATRQLPVRPPRGSTSSLLSVGREALEKASVELRRMVVIFTVVFALAMLPGMVKWLMGTREVGWQAQVVAWSVWSATTALSAWVYLGLTRGRWPLRKVPDLGLTFGVVGAFAIALSENWGRFSPAWFEGTTGFFGGISWVCLWVVIVAIVTPAPPRKVARAAFVAAAMGPLALALNLLAHGWSFPPDRWGMWVTLFWPNFLTAAVAAVAGSVTHELRRQAAEARELGAYRLVERIGAGGMGEVWRAEHSLLARAAAIKLIHPETLAGDDEVRAERALQRFEREAQATAALRSPNTIEVYDFGIGEDGTFYYVMELLSGLTMEDLVDGFGPLPPARALFLLEQVVASLQDAHAHGLVHRDIKPANIFVCSQGGAHDLVKVLDFGLVKTARVADLQESGDDPTLDQPDAGKLTRAGSIIGTPAYMAPELVDPDVEADHRIDIYAVGCVAFWLLTGKLVFEAPTPLQLLARHQLVSPDPVSQHAPGQVPPALEALIGRCLAKSPDERPDTVTLRGELQALCSESPWRASEAAGWWLEHGAAPRVSSAEPTREAPLGVATEALAHDQPLAGEPSLGAAEIALGPTLEAGPSSLSTTDATLDDVGDDGADTTRDRQRDQGKGSPGS